MKRDEAIRDYAATAEAWRTFCEKGKDDVPLDIRAQPTSTLLLYMLAEPVDATPDRVVLPHLTGDVILDALGALRAFVRAVDNSSARGGGGGTWVDNEDIDAWLRRCGILIELRRREHEARGGKLEGGAP